MFLHMLRHPGVDRIPGITKAKKTFSKPIDMVAEAFLEWTEGIHIVILYSWGSKITTFLKKQEPPSKIIFYTPGWLYMYMFLYSPPDRA